MQYYLIIYDISNDRIRSKITQLLESEGAARIQKSVFLMRATANDFGLIREKLQSFLPCLVADNSILALPIIQKQLKKADLIGENDAFVDMLVLKNTLFF